jgi:type IX secretion system PorP/SprF family membrane protein
MAVGFSAPTILPQNIQLNDSVTVHFKSTNLFFLSSYRFKVSETMDLQPGVLLKYLPDVPLSFDINVNMIYREVLTLGFSYRKKESVDFLLKAQATPQLQVGYAYDYPMKSASVMGAGSHELMVSYSFRYRQTNITSPR